METEKDLYFSIKEECRGVYRDKASKFLAFAYPVDSDEEIRQKLDMLRKSYYDANHHCYAYRLGPGDQHYRYNDDGEPSGSAGKPIYGQLLSAGLSDILVVVVRYFGGTKLGIPGLINAYRGATREALADAVKVEKYVVTGFSAIFGYPVMNEVMRVLKEMGCRIVNQQAGELYRIDFQVRKSMAARIEEKILRLRGVELNPLT